MFETDLDESISQSYIRKFTVRFFTVVIIKKPDYLIIEDKRISTGIVLPLLFLLLIVPLLIMFFLLIFGSSLVVIFFGLFFLLAVFLFYLALSASFHQRTTFYRNKDLYEITRTSFLKSSFINGKTSDIKEVRIEVHWSETDEGARVFTSTSYLIFNNLQQQTLERNTFSNDYRTTSKIVFAVCDYLHIPYSEEEFRN